MRHIDTSVTMKMIFGVGLAATTVLGMAAGARADLLYYLPFQDGDDTATLDNFGTVGGTAVETLSHGAPAGAFTADTPDDSAFARTFPTATDAANVYRGSVLELPDSDSRLGGGTGNAGITIAAWVKWDGHVAYPETIVSKGGGAGTVTASDITGYAFSLNQDGGLEFEFDRTTGSAKAIQRKSTQTVPVGVWTHVALTFDESRGYSTSTGGMFYINGQDAGLDISIDAQTLASPAKPILVGARFISNSSPVNGTLDDVRIYDEALTADQIQRLAVIPEPATLVLLGLGGLTLLSCGRSRAV